MLEYLKERIVDEVNDALNYMTKAVELKGHDCSCQVFYKASLNEAEHANWMTKLFISMEKPESVSDADYAKMQKEILETYATSMGKLEALKKLYWQ